MNILLSNKAKEALFNAFGDSKEPLFRSPLTWTLNGNPDERWAILGPNSHVFLNATLLGRARPSPVGSRRWPLFESRAQNVNLDDRIKRVSFSTRLRSSGPASANGDFSDFTARYGHLLEDDKVLLREHFLDHLVSLKGPSDAHEQDILKVGKALDLEGLLEMPVVALSNGQTRRARIARGILSRPELLILEQPLTGLDVASRTSICLRLLEIHQTLAPALIFTLRAQDGLPSFITHAISLSENSKGQGDILSVDRVSANSFQPLHAPPAVKTRKIKPQGQKNVLVEMRNVNVNGRTPVLRNIDWTISAGGKWRLKGANGSGKSTLLAMITGDHPQSFQQDHLRIFGLPRDTLATTILQNQVGSYSPELFNAFPRKHSTGAMTAFDAIASGFDNVFVYRKLRRREDVQRVHSLAAHFGLDDATLKTLFAALPSNKQALVLFLRALVKKPKLLLLDEPFSGMDQATTETSKKYVDQSIEKDQAVILITHFDDEVPSSVDLTFELEKGECIYNSMQSDK